MVAADDSCERKFMEQLNTYYDEVISVIHNAESILIFGPGKDTDLQVSRSSLSVRGHLYMNFHFLRVQGKYDLIF
jgi:hypothetical protein